MIFGQSLVIGDFGFLVVLGNLLQQTRVGSGIGDGFLNGFGNFLSVFGFLGSDFFRVQVVGSFVLLGEFGIASAKYW